VLELLLVGQCEIGVLVLGRDQGTYSDLRRRATRQPIGQGLRPTGAAAGDLARMLEALGRDDDLPRLRTMQRIVELDRGRALEL
jgi:hypothetical protein